MTTVVIGTQWGDEGKGKIVDVYAAYARYTVRFHGGNNAGHTVVIGDKKFFFHLIPSGIFQKKTIGVIANGVILDLEVLIGEMKLVQKAGVKLKNKLIISPRCHIILPYHKALDHAYENARGKNKLGTTGRGIGPTYADKVSYNGLRVYELMHWNAFVEKFTFQAEIKNKILKTFGVPPVDVKKELAKFKKFRTIIAPYVVDTYPVLTRAIAKKEPIVLEGAHGVMLDTDWSPYPFSTGSNTLVGAVNIGAGIPIKNIDTVVGVVKAYLSRVGGGPLPTELTNKLGDVIREKGHEYGTTTGRPRRIGWLDLEAVKFCCAINGVTKVAITKLDILNGFPEIKICVGYTLHGKKIPYSSCGYVELAKLTPVYKTFKGWKEDIAGIRKFNQLPKNCQTYLRFIGKFLGIPLAIISVGAERTA
ncbi:MAG: adenylosuccinate synthase, partial [Candidatus Gottesmanbacteria bacterium]|nr:adenylosuccinate synthase [Candidatus Gottesmanbacteria bacterium]